MNKRLTFLASAFYTAVILLFLLLSPGVGAGCAAGSGIIVEDVEIRGNRRIPRETILYYVQSKQQDRFDLSLAQRDLSIDHSDGGCSTLWRPSFHRRRAKRRKDHHFPGQGISQSSATFNTGV
ncbi:MAG: hypothetical protein IPJ07_23500 [Acidobacteria bacterium]|nr:hypothetical protein [Acidobacteriota bacterium]